MGTTNQGAASEPDEPGRRAWELRAIVDNIPGFVWCLGVDGELRYLNRKVEDYTGKSLEELREPHWREVMHPDDVQPFVAAWIKAMGERLPIMIEFRLRRRDGVYRWFRTTGTPRLDECGILSGWYGVDIDIDDGKRLDDALRMTQAQLAHAGQIAVAAELAASMANAIAQPLAAVVANGYVGKQLLSKAEPNMRHLSDTLDAIIEDATAVAAVAKRIYEGVAPAPPAIAPVDINDAIDEVLSLEDWRLREGRIVVLTTFCPDLPRILADVMLVKQVLTNLIRNSVEAMVGLSDGPRELSIHTQRNEVSIIVELLDTGIGLAAAARPADGSYTTKEIRQGLGLAVAKSIVESCQGAFWSGHNSPRGALIGFSLPLP